MTGNEPRCPGVMKQRYSPLKYLTGTSATKQYLHSRACLSASPGIGQKPTSTQDAQQYLEQADKDSSQLQGMLQGTKWMRVEDRRGRQLQMCSSLVTSKSNFFSPMGSHCLTLPHCWTPKVKSGTEEALPEQVRWFLCQQEPAHLSTQLQEGLHMAAAVFV